MKKLIQKLYELNTKEQKNLVCEEAAKICFINIAVNLQELIQMGFTTNEIEIILDDQLDSTLNELLINTIIKR